MLGSPQTSPKVWAHLEGTGQLLLGAGQGCQDGSGGGADVGAQGERVGSFDTDHTQA